MGLDSWGRTFWGSLAAGKRRLLAGNVVNGILVVKDMQIEVISISKSDYGRLLAQVAGRPARCVTVCSAGVSFRGGSLWGLSYRENRLVLWGSG